MRTAISLLCMLCCLGSASAEISFHAPDSVPLGENFTVVIAFDSKADFDVKIVVQDAEKKPVSQIWDGTAWKSSFYYLPAASPDEYTFTIRVPSPVHNASLCVRLRKMGSSIYEETCKPFFISDQISAPPSQDQEKPSSITLHSPSKKLLTKEHILEKFIAWSAIVFSTLILIWLFLWAVTRWNSRRKVVFPV